MRLDHIQMFVNKPGKSASHSDVDFQVNVYLNFPSIIVIAWGRSDCYLHSYQCCCCSTTREFVTCTILLQLRNFGQTELWTNWFTSSLDLVRGPTLFYHSVSARKVHCKISVQGEAYPGLSLIRQWEITLHKLAKALNLWAGWQA